MYLSFFVVAFRRELVIKKLKGMCVVWCFVIAQLFPFNLFLFIFNVLAPLGLDPTATPEEQLLSLNMEVFWTNFARFGQPGFDIDNTIEWPPYGIERVCSLFMLFIIYNTPNHKL